MIEVGHIEPDDYEIRCEDGEWDDLKKIVEHARVKYHSAEVYLHVAVDALESLLAEMRDTDEPPGLLDRMQTCNLFMVIWNTGNLIVPALPYERHRDLVRQLSEIDIWEMFEKVHSMRGG